MKVRTRANAQSIVSGGALVAVLAFGLTVLPAGARASSELTCAAPAVRGDPMGVVRAMVEEALGILRDGETPVDVRQDKLRGLIAPVFDFTTMSRFALGYHWRDLTPTQRTEFVSVFSHFIRDSYVSRINKYSGQQVEFGKVTFDGEEYAQVHTRIVERGKPSTAVNYRLEHQHGAWKIYDVTVDNLSILANYRNQFSRVMNKDGYAALVGDLRRKQRALASSLGGGC